MLRHVSPTEFTLWLVTSEHCHPELLLYRVQNGQYHRLTVPEQNSEILAHQVIKIGQHAYIHLLQINTRSVFLDPEAHYAYDIMLPNSNGLISIAKSHSTLRYEQQAYFHFRVPGVLKNVMHGSCRKPHHPEQDALAQLDRLIEVGINQPEDAPDVVFFTGDQIYADDVSGPMLFAIHQVIALLGLWDESFPDTDIDSAYEKLSQSTLYYQRESILPDTQPNEDVLDNIFSGKRKPLFTSVHAQNHLMSLAEILGMYLLTWSDTLWQLIDLSPPELSENSLKRYRHEQDAIEGFIETLPNVRRALAHIPNYYIFDDHDVTDDWNLTRAWEEGIYGHGFSRRIIANALIGYWLCQGMGNQPMRTQSLLNKTVAHFSDSTIIEHTQLGEKLLNWSCWDYQLATSPPVRVLDTRTQRWRSETSKHKPSGLMDWESLVEFQQSLVGEDDVIVVSAAPIYGVKFIETIQRFFTWIGKALTVDAENWMAHKGTANVILNIFKHERTPPRFIILSGDVHYSFVYDVRLRFQKNSPQILQFTCSGLKNAFPTALIEKLDKINQWCYSSKSPLNIFTKRRDMKIIARVPEGFKGKELINIPALGWLALDPNNTASNDATTCSIVTNYGKKITFKAD
jgi:hypothetical protein